MKMDKKTYNEYVKTRTEKSPIVKDCIYAFVFGGVICTIGELILNLFQTMGLNEKNSSVATTIAMIFIGALLTGLNIYPKLAKYAGAGTIVPITGFSNAVSSAAIESKAEGYVLGVGTKIFSIAGPVILYGEISSVICGIIYFILH